MWIIIKTAPPVPVLYFATLGVNTNAKNEKNGFMTRMREPTADYIPKGLPQLIVIVNYVWRKEALTMSKAKRIEIEGSVNGRYYLELPDGYRLIYDNDGYVGRYNPNLSEAI